MIAFGQGYRRVERKRPRPKRPHRRKHPLPPRYLRQRRRRRRWLRRRSFHKLHPEIERALAQLLRLDTIEGRERLRRAERLNPMAERRVVLLLLLDFEVRLNELEQSVSAAQI